MDLRIGLIGYGRIGQGVALLLAERAAQDITLVGALVRDPAQVRSPGPAIITTCSELLARQPHVVVEAAGQRGLREHGPAVLRAGIDLTVVSVGAFADPEVFQTFLEAAHTGNARIKVVSGAIGVLDAIAAAAVGGLTNVVHTMHKPPKALLAPDDAARLTEIREIFRGNARQAVERFPEFLNVAASVSLAGCGFDHTEVRVLADPYVEHSLHKVQVEGPFGMFRFEITNQPVSDGQGARLVAMSVVHSLLLRRATFIIG